MGACRGAPVTKQADVDRARKKKKCTAKQDAHLAAELAIHGPVTAQELAEAKGWARRWLLVVQRAQRIEASFAFQICITAVILIAAVMIGFSTLPTVAKIPTTMLVMEWVINGIFIFEIILKMVAKKWRPLEFFVATNYEWT
mgnify:CR=1 FL=1